MECDVVEGDSNCYGLSCELNACSVRDGMNVSHYRVYMWVDVWFVDEHVHRCKDLTHFSFDINITLSPCARACH